MNSILVPKLKCSKKLGSLISSAAKHLESLGYRQGTIKNYQYIWKEFVQKNSEKETFSTGLVVQFLDSCGISDKVETSMTLRQRHIRNVMQLLG